MNSLLPLSPLQWQIKTDLSWPPAPETIRSILVVHLLPLGDFTIATPFLRNLRALYPQAKITLATQAASAQLAATCPYIDSLQVSAEIRLHLGQDRSAATHFGMQLKQTNFAPFDLCMVPRYDHDHLQAGVVAAAAGGRYTIGYSRDCTPLKKRISAPDADDHYNVLANAPNGFHDVQYQLALLTGLGNTERDFPHPEPVEGLGKSIEKKFHALRQAQDEEFFVSSSFGMDQPLELWANMDDGRMAQAALDTLKLGPNKYVVFGLGASQAYKIWGIENFCALAQRIYNHYGLKILTVGALDYEIEMASQLCAYMGTDKAQSVAGHLPSRASYLMIAASRMVVTVDSFLAHAAAAARKPVCVIYSTPTDCPPVDMFHPSRIHPWQTAYRAVQPASCGPIDEILPRHHRAPHCVNNVTVDQVWQAVQELL